MHTTVRVLNPYKVRVGDWKIKSLTPLLHITASTRMAELSLAF